MSSTNEDYRPSRPEGNPDLVIQHSADLHPAYFQYFRFSAQGVEVVGDPTYEDWSKVFGGLTRIHGGIQWLLGDMLAIGESRFGEKYTQAVDATGYSLQTLMNMASVAGRIKLPFRNANLSFTHHAAVAYLDSVEDRVLLLGQAEVNAWSATTLREVAGKYKKALRGSKSTSDGRSKALSSVIRSPTRDAISTSHDSELTRRLLAEIQNELDRLAPGLVSVTSTSLTFLRKGTSEELDEVTLYIMGLPLVFEAEREEWERLGRDQFGDEVFEAAMIRAGLSREDALGTDPWDRP